MEDIQSRDLLLPKTEALQGKNSCVPSIEKSVDFVTSSNVIDVVLVSGVSVRGDLQ